MNAARLGLAAVILVVLGAILAGLLVSGSPEQQRLLRADQQRVSDLQRILRSIQTYYREAERLPPDLATMVDGRISSGIPSDPETEAAYEYEVIGDAEFRLCADFALESPPADARLEFWTHAAGRDCYPFNFTSMPTD